MADTVEEPQAAVEPEPTPPEETPVEVPPEENQESLGQEAVETESEIIPEPTPEQVAESTQPMEESVTEPDKVTSGEQSSPSDPKPPEETEKEPKILKPKIPRKAKKRIATYQDYSEEEQENILNLTDFHQRKEAYEGHPERLEQFRKQTINDWIHKHYYKSKEITKPIQVLNPKNFHPSTKVEMLEEFVGTLQAIVNVLLTISMVFIRLENAMLEIIVRLLALMVMKMVNKFVGGLKSNLESYKDTALSGMENPEEQTEETTSKIEEQVVAGV